MIEIRSSSEQVRHSGGRHAHVEGESFADLHALAEGVHTRMNDIGRALGEAGQIIGLLNGSEPYPDSIPDGNENRKHLYITALADQWLRVHGPLIGKGN